MRINNWGQILILSAHRGHLSYLSSVCNRHGHADPWCISDPAELDRASGESELACRRALGQGLGGAILDLTPPTLPFDSTPKGNQPFDRDFEVSDERGIAWSVEALLMVLVYLSTIPLVLVSPNAQLEDILTRRKAMLVARVALTSADAIWERVFTHLEIHRQRMQIDREWLPTRQPWDGQTNRFRFKLGPHLWIDLAACTVHIRERVLPLTAREVRLLSVLKDAPRCFLSVEELAHRLTLPGRYPVDAHSVEQTISVLRRKFGDPARQARILINRRGLGYALFFQD